MATETVKSNIFQSIWNGITGKNTSNSRVNGLLPGQVPTVPDAVYGQLAGVFDYAGAYGGDPTTMPFGLGYSNAYTPLTLQRVLLNYSYMTHGIVQTLIDQPVEDAFRGGIDIRCDELDEDDLADFQQYLERMEIYKIVKDAMKWAKLFGGAGIIINTDQDPQTELDIDSINEKTPLGFISADRWELLLEYMIQEEVECPYNYMGQKIHRSRVIKIMGKEAPSMVRQRLQGWGMSELERLIRSINSYVKNQDVIYQLLDEAKIDVYKIKDYNTQGLSQAAAGKLDRRLNVQNRNKNYHSAIIMDMTDDYQQKQLTFAGLAEMLNQIRIGIAADVRMPMTKLFGLSASGFNSGEDDIENYNSMIESEVRAKAREVMHKILPIIAKQIFGYIPENIDFEFKPLRVLSAVDEEAVKTSEQNRIFQMYHEDILTGVETAENLKQEDLLTMDCEVLNGDRVPEKPQPFGMQGTEPGQADQKGTVQPPKKAPSAGVGPKTPKG